VSCSRLIAINFKPNSTQEKAHENNNEKKIIGLKGAVIWTEPEIVEGLCCSVLGVLRQGNHPCRAMLGRIYGEQGSIESSRAEGGFLRMLERYGGKRH